MSKIVMKQRPHGFFSECHWLLTRIANEVRNNRAVPDIDSTKAFFLYKNDEQITGDVDLRPHFFNVTTDNIEELPGDVYTYGPTNVMYKADFTDNVNLIDTPITKAMFENVYTPSDHIKTMVIDLLNKYQFDLNKTCYVYYRGNDKLARESLDVPIERYIECLTQAKQNGCDHILIQTDVHDFYESMSEVFDNVSMIDETWIGISQEKHVRKAIHRDLAHNSDILDNISALLSSLLIGAQSNRIVSNTSGFSLFLQLYRCLLYGKLHADDVILYTRDPKISSWESKLPQYK